MRLLAEAGTYSSTLLLDDRTLVRNCLRRTNVADELFHCIMTSVSKTNRPVYLNCSPYRNSSCGSGRDDPTDGVARQVLVQGQEAVARVGLGYRSEIVHGQSVG